MDTARFYLEIDKYQSVASSGAGLPPVPKLDKRSERLPVVQEKSDYNPCKTSKSICQNKGKCENRNGQWVALYITSVSRHSYSIPWLGQSLLIDTYCFHYRHRLKSVHFGPIFEMYKRGAISADGKRPMRPMYADRYPSLPLSWASRKVRDAWAACVCRRLSW